MPATILQKKDQVFRDDSIRSLIKNTRVNSNRPHVGETELKIEADMVLVKTGFLLPQEETKSKERRSKIKSKELMNKGKIKLKEGRSLATIMATSLYRPA